MRNFSVNADAYKSNRKQVFQVMQAAHCYSATLLIGDTHQGSLHGSLAASEILHVANLTVPKVASAQQINKDIQDFGQVLSLLLRLQTHRHNLSDSQSCYLLPLEAQ